MSEKKIDPVQPTPEEIDIGTAAVISEFSSDPRFLVFDLDLLVNPERSGEFGALFGRTDLVWCPECRMNHAPKTPHE